MLENESHLARPGDEQSAVVNLGVSMKDMNSSAFMNF
jgi:hypothetical protein